MKNPSVLSDTGRGVLCSAFVSLPSLPLLPLRPPQPCVSQDSGSGVKLEVTVLTPRSVCVCLPFGSSSALPFFPIFISAACPLYHHPCCLHPHGGYWEGCWETSCLVLWEPQWGSSGGWSARRRWQGSQSHAWWRKSGRGSSGCQAPEWGWALSCPGESYPGPASLWTPYTAVCMGKDMAKHHFKVSTN